MVGNADIDASPEGLKANKPAARPGMELGDLRESPAGSGESDVGEWREVTPGEEAAGTDGTKAETELKDTCREDETQRGVGEPVHSPYEEELDPRIQVGPSVSDGNLTLINS